MSILATDNFNRADNADLGANWTAPQGASVEFRIVSNTAQPHSFSADSFEYENTQTWPNDQYAQAAVTISGTGSQSGIGVAVRMSTSAKTFYWAVVCTAATNNISVHRFNTGTATLLSQSTQAWTNGDILRLEISGATPSTLKVFRNGIQVGADIVDNSPIASGAAGVAFSSTVTSGLLDDWEGGGIGAPGLSGSSLGVASSASILFGAGALIGTSDGISTAIIGGSLPNLRGSTDGTSTASGQLSFIANISGHSYGGEAAGNLTLSWDANTEPDLAGYRVYIGTETQRSINPLNLYGYTGAPYVSPVNVGNVTTFTIFQLPRSETYYFAITAYNNTGGESGFSNEVSWLVPYYGSVVGILAASGAVSGISNGTVLVLGSLVAGGPLAGSSAGVSSTDVFLSGTSSNNGSGAADGLSNATGLLTGAGALAGSVSCTPSFLANLSTTATNVMLISGSSSGTVVITSVLYGIGSLQSPTVLCTATVVGEVMGVGELSASSEGVSALTGLLQGLGGLSGTAIGKCILAKLGVPRVIGTSTHKKQSPHRFDEPVYSPKR